MDPLDELLTWAKAKGVKLDGIKPERMPGRGVGIVATRQIAAGDLLLEVPTPCLRTTNTVSRAVAQRLPRTITVHGLLAADLALASPRDTARYAPWNAVCPAPADFATVPLLWPPELQALLPPPARELLARQRDKFARDWADVSTAYRDLLDAEEEEEDVEGVEGGEALSVEDRYRHAWLLVNTRTFYYVSSRLRRKVRASDTDNCMCLQPVADLFNHDDGEAGGCNVAFDGAGYSVRAERAYDVGDEVRISYGRHPGDMLLVEYGFSLDDNRWDEVGLDDVLLPRFTRTQADALADAGFRGRYVLDRDGVCHRTQVAVRRLCCSLDEWRRFAAGVDDGAASQPKVDRLLVEILAGYRGKIEETIRRVEGLTGVGEPEQRAVLAQRWGQIRALVTSNITRLQDGINGASS